MIESFVHKCKENFQKFVIIPIHVFIGMVRKTFHSFFFIFSTLKASPSEMMYNTHAGTTSEVWPEMRSRKKQFVQNYREQIAIKIVFLSFRRWITLESLRAIYTFLMIWYHRHCLCKTFFDSNLYRRPQFCILVMHRNAPSGCSAHLLLSWSEMTCCDK